LSVLFIYFTAHLLQQRPHFKNCQNICQCNWTKVASKWPRRRWRDEMQSVVGWWFIDLTATQGFIHWRRQRMTAVPGTSTKGISDNDVTLLL